MAKNRLNFEAHLGRHRHNTDAGYASSLTTGPIVPQYFDILSPGDTLYFQPSMFVRMQDVVTAFFGQVDVHMDAFFVPLQMLYTNFGAIYTQTQDYISSFYANSQLGDGFPLFDIEGTVHDGSNGIDLRVSRFVEAECKGKEYMRLLDALDENPFIVLNLENATASGHTLDPDIDFDFALCHSPMISPWLFCAYQAIYQKYYRNEEFETFDIGAFNIDSHYDSYNIGFKNSKLLMLRYHQRVSDYFTDLRVSPIASAVNKAGMATVNVESFPSEGSNLSDVFYKVDSFLNSNNNTFKGQDFGRALGFNSDTSFDNISTTGSAPHDSAGGAYFSFLNTSNIRSLFALDKFLRIWGRAGKTYDDQILAHFGVKIPHDVKHDLTHIKHYQASLTADPIYGTANIPNGDDYLVTSLGQVGAQAQCTVGGDSCKFTAPVHGVFMVVAYALTKPIYEGTFSKLHLLTDRLSFPIPEFDKFGAQPIYTFELNPQYLNGQNLSRRSGWQNRYEQFKRKYNRCSFTYSNVYLNYRVDGVANVFSPWLLSRTPFKTMSGDHLVAAPNFFENVGALDTVMVKQFDASWQESYWSVPHKMFQTDPLITNFYCKVKKVSWMSETGEPDL